MKKDIINKDEKIYVIILFTLGIFLGFNMGLDTSMKVIFGLIIGFIIGRLDKLNKLNDVKTRKNDK